MDLLNLRSLYFDERLSIASRGSCSRFAAPPTATDYAQFANQDSVLCIDNGATTLRAGWNRESPTGRVDIDLCPGEEDGPVELAVSVL
jgi:hypothetical protein